MIANYRRDMAIWMHQNELDMRVNDIAKKLQITAAQVSRYISEYYAKLPRHPNVEWSLSPVTVGFENPQWAMSTFFTVEKYEVVGKALTPSLATQ